MTSLRGNESKFLRAQWVNLLTHWGRVTHICVSNLTIIGSDNGLSTGRRQAIIWTNAGILLILRNKLQWNLNRNSYIFIQENAFKCRLENGGHFVSASMCSGWVMHICTRNQLIIDSDNALSLVGCQAGTETNPGVGVTKAPFVHFSVSKIFDMAKVHLRFFESHSYLTGVTAAELRRHLPNINTIFNS